MKHLRTYKKFNESLEYNGITLWPFRSNLLSYTDDQLEYYWNHDNSDVIMYLQDVPDDFEGGYDKKKKYLKNYIDPKLKEIINRYDVNTKADEFGRVPLIAALHLGYLEVVRELLRNGADISIKDGYGDAPIDIRLSKEIWEEPLVQDLVLTHQPQNYKLLLNKIGELDPEVKKKHDYLFDSEELGILENNKQQKDIDDVIDENIDMWSIESQIDKLTYINFNDEEYDGYKIFANLIIDYESTREMVQDYIRYLGEEKLYSFYDERKIFNLILTRMFEKYKIEEKLENKLIELLEEYPGDYSHMRKFYPNKITQKIKDKFQHIDDSEELGTTIFNIIKNKESYERIKNNPNFDPSFLNIVEFISYDDIEMVEKYKSTIKDRTLISALRKDKNFVSDEMIEYLVNNGIDINHVNNDDTALSCAVRTNLSVCEKLIEVGADVNYVKRGFSILNMFFQHKFTENRLPMLKKLIINGADTTFINNSGKSIFDGHKQVWKDCEIQKFVLEQQPQAAYLIHKSVGLCDELKDEFGYLIDSEELGLL